MNEYVKFELVEQKEKTAVYVVKSTRSDDSLGKISWFGIWRRYVFYPFEDAIFDSACLTEISKFLSNLMDKRESEKHPTLEIFSNIKKRP